MTLKILYDYQIFEQEFGGISHCFFKHIEAAQGSGNIKIILPIKYHDNYHLNKINKSKDGCDNFYENLKKKIIGKKRYRNFVKNSNQSLSIKALTEGEFDVFRPTYYDPYFLKYIGNKPFVLDMHDMTPEIFPEFSIKGNLLERKKLLAQKASKIIAVSHNTKNDIINLFDINENKIDVIYHGNTFEGVEIEKVCNLDLQKKLPKKYLLFVGNREGYKNFYFFLSAISKIILQDDNLELLCTGLQFSSHELNFIRNLGLENKVGYFSVTNDNDMIVLYKNAQAFVFPSLYEGFGLPILEAFSCRCPVIASNTSSIPEIAQNAAIYFDPKNYHSIKNAVEKVLYDNELRIDLANKGLNRLKDFSWQNNIEKTFEIYKQII